MVGMSFPDRMRIGAAALVAAAALSQPGTALAAPSGPTPTAVAASAAPAQLEKTDHGYALRIAPGQTIDLKPEATPGVAYSVEEGQQSTLPAGWSVLTSAAGLRITAPRTAADGEYATVKVTGAGEDPDTPTDLCIVVERPEAAAALPQEAPGTSTASSWFGDIFGRFASLFVS